MRNLKKYLAVALTIAMLLTIAAPATFASASDNFATEANTLNQLGLYKGIATDGTFNPDLGSNLNRQTGATMLLRMFGLEDDALAMDLAAAKATLRAKFKDAASVSDWAAKQVAYAVENGVINGFPDGTFQPNGLLTGRQYCTLVLNQLGYKGQFQFEQAGDTYAAKAGLNATDAAAFGVNAPIKKSVLIGISNSALTTKLDGKDTTLIQQLVNNGAVDKAKADAAGFKVVAPTVAPTAAAGTPTPAVTSVVYANYGSVNVKAEMVAGAPSVARGQSLIDIGTLSLTAGADADATITGITMNRTGLSSDSTDVANLTVWDGATRVNTPAVFSNGVANIGFTTNVVVPKGTSKILALRFDVPNGASVGAQMMFSINATSGIKTNAVVNGSFPVNSGVFTVSGLALNSLGTLAVALAGDSPAQGTVNPGATNVTLGKWDFTANNEAQKLQSVLFTNNGSAGDNDVTNLNLFNGTTQVGSGSLANRKISFTFNPGLDIANGGKISLTLKGDVSSNASGRTFIFQIANTTDVLAKGSTYGANISATAGSVAASTAATLTGASGSLTLGLDVTNPAAGTIAANGKDQVFAIFKVQASGEPVQIQKINLKVTPTEVSNTPVAHAAAPADLTNVKITAGTTVVASVQAPFTTITTAAQTIEFTLSNPLVVNPGTPVALKVTADVAAAANATDTYKVAIPGIAAAVTAVGNYTSNQANKDLSTSGDVAGNVMTVGNLGVTPTYTTVSGTDYAFSNQPNHYMGGVSLTHNLTEPVSISALKVRKNLVTAEVTEVKCTAAENGATTIFDGQTFTQDGSATIPEWQAGMIALTYPNYVVTAKDGTTDTIVITKKVAGAVADLTAATVINAGTQTVGNLTVTVTTQGGLATGSNIMNLVAKDAQGNALTNVIDAPAATNNLLTLNTPITLKPGETKEIKFYADIASGASPYDTISIDIAGAAADITAVTVASGNNVNTLTPVGTVQSCIIGLPVSTGMLTAAQSNVANLSAGNISAGKTGVKLAAATLSLNAAVKEPVLLKKVALNTTYSTLTSGDISNVRIVDGAGNVLATQATLTSGSVVTTLTTPLEIPISTVGKAEIAVLADISAVATAGGQVTVDMGDAGGANADWEYTGKNSGTTVQTANSQAAGVAFTVRPSTVTVTRKALTNTNPPAAGGVEIGKFTIKNEGAVGVEVTQLSVQDVLATTNFSTQGGCTTATFTIVDDTGTTLFNTAAGDFADVNYGGGAAAGRTENFPIIATKLRLNPGQSKDISIIMSDVGTVTATKATMLKVLKATTLYKTLDGVYTSQPIDTDCTLDSVSFK